MQVRLGDSRLVLLSDSNNNIISPPSKEPKTDKDEEYCRKVNELLNNPPTPGSARTMGARGGGAGAGSESMPDYSMMNQLLNMGGSGGGSGEERMDLQHVLAGMDQQQLMQLLSKGAERFSNWLSILRKLFLFF